ncbi:MAG: cellulase family glycosylhydrolase [Chthonomonadales bacterium]
MRLKSFKSAYLVFILLAAIFMVGVNAYAQNVKPVRLSRINLSVGASTGSALFKALITPANRSAKVGIQFIVQRAGPKGKAEFEYYVAEDENGPRIFDLHLDSPTLVSQIVPLARGIYQSCRIQLFHSADGKTIDMHKIVFDTGSSDAGDLPLHLTIGGNKKLLLPDIKLNGETLINPTSGGNYTVMIPAEVHIPTEYTNSAGGIWTAAKGPGGTVRQFAKFSDAVAMEDSQLDYKRIPIKFFFPSASASVWSVEIGIARPKDVNEVVWSEKRADFQIGGESWRRKAASVPPRVIVKANRFVLADGGTYDPYPDFPSARSAVRFLRGGNYGNSVCWTVSPAHNDPSYFRKLKAIGIRFLRCNFNADRYLDEPLYQNVVDQIAQNIMAAGLYPIISPQEFPHAASDPQKVYKAVQLMKILAERYKGQPIWYHILNEPDLFQQWETWRPVAIKMVRAIRSIDPDAFVIVPFEGWSVDGRGAAKDPIREVRVDLYDGHAYVNPGDVAKLYAPAIQAGLPVMIGEYGGGTGSYMRAMDKAIQDLPPGLMAIAPWAFTVPGMDFLALVQSVTPDGLTFTETGQPVADDFALWNKGQKR